MLKVSMYRNLVYFRSFNSYICFTEHAFMYGIFIMMSFLYNEIHLYQSNIVQQKVNAPTEENSLTLRE